jgi:hypothetical protein
MTVRTALNAIQSARAIKNNSGARAVLAGYLHWLIASDPESIPADLRPSRDRAIAEAKELNYGSAAAAGFASGSR